MHCKAIMKVLSDWDLNETKLWNYRENNTTLYIIALAHLLVKSYLFNANLPFQIHLERLPHLHLCQTFERQFQTFLEELNWQKDQNNI